MYNTSKLDKIIKVLIFIIINYIILKFILRNTVTEYVYLQILIINTICFMFVYNYYPCISLQNIQQSYIN